VPLAKRRTWRIYSRAMNSAVSSGKGIRISGGCRSGSSSFPLRHSVRSSVCSVWLLGRWASLQLRCGGRCCFRSHCVCLSFRAERCCFEIRVAGYLDRRECQSSALILFPILAVLADLGMGCTAYAMQMQARTMLCSALLCFFSSLPTYLSNCACSSSSHRRREHSP
jgi:hypothetical protein